MTARTNITDEQRAKLERVVTGAIRDTLNMHPDYVSRKGRRVLVNSLRKRLVGQLGSLIAGEGRPRSPSSADGAFFAARKPSVRVEGNSPDRVPSAVRALFRKIVTRWGGAQ